MESRGKKKIRGKPEGIKETVDSLGGILALVVVRRDGEGYDIYGLY